MNIVILSGRLTRKPELRTTQNLKHICHFSIAINRGYDDNVDFIECVCFDKIAENLVKYQDKGNMIELKGNLKTDSYIDKDNKKHSKTLVYVEMINYINSTKKSENEQINVQNDAFKEFGKKIQDDLVLPF